MSLGARDFALRREGLCCCGVCINWPILIVGSTTGGAGAGGGGNEGSCCGTCFSPCTTVSLPFVSILKTKEKNMQFTFVEICAVCVCVCERERERDK